MAATPLPTAGADAVTEILDNVTSSAGNPVSDVFTEVAESTGLTGVLHNLTGMTLSRFLSLVALAAVCLVVMKLVQRFVRNLLERGTIEKSLHAFIRATVKILLWFLFFLIMASALGIDVTSLVAVLSVAGLAVSLAVQGILSNLAGGLQVLTSKTFKVGDYIETNSVSGTVAEIGMAHTKLTTIDNKVIYIPNSEIASAKILNYNPQERRRVDLVFSASYDDPTACVVGAIRGVVDAHPKALQDPEPFVRLSAFKDSCVEYTVRVWCETEDYWDLYYDLLEQVRDAFDQQGITMTYPHMNVHIQKS